MFPSGFLNIMRVDIMRRFLNSYVGLSRAVSKTLQSCKWRRVPAPSPSIALQLWVFPRNSMMSISSEKGEDFSNYSAFANQVVAK